MTIEIKEDLTGSILDIGGSVIGQICKFRAAKDMPKITASDPIYSMIQRTSRYSAALRPGS